ncbi:MAG TPA: hypothetical protein VFE69_13435 [Ilumatobacteraceae bacterium]|nr:hypothetical protein [Ilumatobacteraceae bacterium]
MSQRIFDICVKGEMSPALREAFEDVDVTIDRGFTRLRLVAHDTTMLHGLLDRLESFGLELLDIHSVDPQPTAPPLLS